MTRRQDPGQLEVFAPVAAALTDAVRWGVQRTIALEDRARWSRRLDQWRPGMTPSRSRLVKKVDEATVWLEDADRRQGEAIATVLREGGTVEQIDRALYDVEQGAHRPERPAYVRPEAPSVPPPAISGRTRRPAEGYDL